MKSEINRIYDKITPPLSSEEVTARVLERAGKAERKRTFRPVIAAAAAAVTVCAATVAAGAVNDWDYLGIFEKIFGERAQSMSENIISEAEVLENTFADVSFEVVAAAADPTTFMIVVDSYGGGDDREFIYDLKCENPDSDYEGFEYRKDCERVSDNCVRTTLYMTGDFDEKTYRLFISDIKGDSENCIVRLKADYSAQTFLHPVNEYVSLNQGVCWRIENVEISALSMRLSGVNGEYYPTVFEIDRDKTFAVTSDGEKHAVKIYSYWGAVDNDMRVDNDVYLAFDEPLDPNDVTAIDFGTDVLELK